MAEQVALKKKLMLTTHQQIRFQRLNRISNNRHQATILINMLLIPYFISPGVRPTNYENFCTFRLEQIRKSAYFLCRVLHFSVDKIQIVRLRALKIKNSRDHSISLVINAE